MHETTFQRLRDECSLLRLEMQAISSTPAAEYGEIITGVWLSEPPALVQDGQGEDERG